jgi:hypothetical protein
MLHAVGHYFAQSAPVATGTSADKNMMAIRAPSGLHAFLTSLQIFSDRLQADIQLRFGVFLISTTFAGGDAITPAAANNSMPSYGGTIVGGGTEITSVTLSGTARAVLQGNAISELVWTPNVEEGFIKIPAGTDAIIRLLNAPASDSNVIIRANLSTI